jgi:hypothetical protein
MPRKPPRPRAGGAAFPPLSDEELVEFLRELTETLPDDLAESVTAALERGDDPAGVARVVRDELRSRGQIPS